MKLTEEDRRVIGLWAADCAARVLPLFEAKATSDTRPHDAIAGIRAFARAEMRKAPLRSLAMAAHAAARDVHDPAAAAAARAAGVAAATAFMHDDPATMGTLDHALGSAAYAAHARELAADDPDAADEELAWAVEHASPAAREVVVRIPPASVQRGRIAALVRQLDAALRADSQPNGDHAATSRCDSAHG